MVAIADLSACDLPFDLPQFILKDVKIMESDPQTKVVATLAESDVPVCFKIDQDKWKIDALGSLEQLQQHARVFLQRKGASPD